MTRRVLIAGNWKMNGLQEDGAALARGVSDNAWDKPCDILVCPPTILIMTVAGEVEDTPVALGGQDCHMAEKGAHTGDISAAMLADAGCSYVILGHSERRADHGEGDAIVRAKAEAAWAAGLIAIICVGETEAEREAGKTLDVIATQLAGSIPDGATSGNTVIAYEPIWAIGTGKTATPEDAQAVHAHIRADLSKRFKKAMAQGTRILYGGSMKPGNAAELLAQKDIDGGLIGGAALKAEDFLAIIDAVPAD